MAMMECLENVIVGHGNRLPFLTVASETFYSLLVISALPRLRRDHMRYRLAMPGNRHGLTVLDCSEEFRQMRLGFSGFYGTHENSNQLI